jgi:GxxExxY protein
VTLPERRTGDPETFAIIGAALEVHRTLGSGFLEAVSKAALILELRNRQVPVQQEVSFPIYYKGERLGLTYRADLVCVGSVIVEVKATSGLGPVDQAQAINYLKVSGLQRASS